MTTNDADTRAVETYHYSECGLDDVYLANGFEFAESPSGRQIIITGIDALHEAIGRSLAFQKKDLVGNEIRFLRHEMGMSQALLARLLDVSDQAINRWEKNKSNISKPAEALIRALYAEHIKENSGIRQMLREIGDLEDAMDGDLTFRKRRDEGWEQISEAEAA